MNQTQNAMKDSITITKLTISLLRQTQYDLSFEIFKELFGAQAYHLWDKFSDMYDSNLLDFFHYLDESNKEIMLQHINHKIIKTNLK